MQKTFAIIKDRMEEKNRDNAYKAKVNSQYCSLQYGKMAKKARYFKAYYCTRYLYKKQPQD